jgi:hypothetical protein
MFDFLELNSESVHFITVRNGLGIMCESSLPCKAIAKSDCSMVRVKTIKTEGRLPNLR